MGTVCALLLAEHGTPATLWGAFPEQIAELARDRENRRFLPGYPLPPDLTVTSAADAAFADTELAISAVPCQYLRSVWTRLAPHVPANVPVVSVTKGIEVETLLRPSEVIQACARVGPIVCLSGPCIGPEVAARKPAGVVVACADQAVARRVQEAMSTRYFRVYTSTDVVGLELAGAVKNVIALAAGICDGIEAGCNAKAALLTRGLVEIARLGVAMGAQVETFRGLAGIGDLVTTCISPISRNRSAGEKIGRGMSCAEVVESTRSVIEGIATTRSVLALAQKHNVEMPITRGVASVLFEGCRPQDAIDRLMTRPLRSES